MSRELKKKKGGGGSDQRLDIADFTVFTFTAENRQSKGNYFHCFISRLHAFKLRMNITACTAAHAELILKPYVISHRFSAFMLKAMKIR